MIFTIYGLPQAAGSKRHVGNGRIIDSNPKASGWKDMIAEAAVRAADAGRSKSLEGGLIQRRLLDGPLSLELRFFLPRPKGHYSKRRRAIYDLAVERDAEAVEALGRDPSISGFESRPSLLLPSAPAFPTTRPDVLKLARAVEDALTGVVWRDDAQIVEEILLKFYGEPARVEVRIVPATEGTHE